MSPRIARVLLAALLVSALVACGEGKPSPTGVKTELKLNLKKGDIRKLDYDVEMETTVKAQGQKVAIDMTMGFGITFDVRDVDSAGVHDVKATYDAVRMTMSGPLSMSYNSANKNNPPSPATPIFDAMVGAVMTFKMKPDGTTVSMDASDLEKRVSAAGGGDSGSQLKGLEQSLNQFATYPKGPVDLGDTWTASMDMTNDPSMPMTTSATYMLMERNNGVARIKVDGTIKGTNSNLAGTMKGNLYMEESTGWIKSGELKMEMSGDVKGASMDMDMTATLKGS